ncbi:MULTISPECIES: DNA-directed RNA polymerase subunit omega [unclassified Francisella]|uniref:DNA-directed RNA polymerase subunit omega n=1 Tax=unclassified Francisella TaxID=2610885 RepID=UPI002E30E98F|nr:MULTISPECIES: DNA-directed RNA polymerase subunit omega [unclassified Francisella]MED7819752.1 DNA-directed RNA polymerase subunit omega [Francisella sp. 19S2-4]MED7830572.1 DNA-directed RNA polymerase subunit omega [Francisella sp. 19S2-10]
MARVTIEDCLDKVETRFDLVVLASMRANYILKKGYSESIENEKKEKATVVALREIAESEITPEQIFRSEIEG